MGLTAKFGLGEQCLVGILVLEVGYGTFGQPANVLGMLLFFFVSGAALNILVAHGTVWLGLEHFWVVLQELEN